jgi:hypothetical protein
MEEETKSVDTKPVRSPEEITKDYCTHAQTAGDLAFRIAVMSEELQGLYKAMWALGSRTNA